MRRSHGNRISGLNKSTRARQNHQGFTLLEIMLVIALLGLLVQLTAINLGAFLPEWRLRSASKRLATRLTFLASEARLQGNTFCLEFDLDRSRIRTHLPPDLGQAEFDEKTPPMLRTVWSYLEKPLVIEAIQLGTRDHESKTGKVIIPFRARGTTVDAVIVLADPQYENSRKYLRLKGLDGSVEVTDEEIFLPEVTDNDFM